MTLIATSIERVTTTSAGGQTNGNTYIGKLSPDGTKLLFLSDASNLTANDTNGTFDVFVKDLTTGAVTLVSGSSTGAVGNSNSEITDAAWSPDGTKVLFYSAASNLVAGDDNGSYDVFLKDLTTGDLSIVSRNSEGELSNGGNYAGRFSPDGTKVAFGSTAWNLVEGDPDPNGGPFIVQQYIKDLATGEVTRISNAANGDRGNSHSEPGVWSPDGTKLAFYTYASNITPDGNVDSADLIIKDINTGAIEIVPVRQDGYIANFAWQPSFSPDGTKIMFMSEDPNLTPGDTNNAQDVYIKDLATGEIVNVSHGINGVPFNGNSGQAVWSPDGTRIAFFNEGWNPAPGDNNHGYADIFVKDLITGVVSRMSINLDGVGGNGFSQNASWSADGTKLIFGSESNNLVTGDTNGRSDLFVVTLQEDNVINGTNGFDHVNGRDTSETYRMRDGNDSVHANGGDDVIRGGNGEDSLWGDAGNDRVLGENNDDTLHGGDGNDELRGGEGDDRLYGDNDADTLFGDNGADTLYGGFGTDKLRGGDGDDTLYGGNANDDLRGDAGSDTLVGGAHADNLYGGADGDNFVFDADALVGAYDTVRDFNAGENDAIVLDHLLVGYDNLTSAIGDFVSLVESGVSSLLQVDRDGTGGAYSFQTVAKLQGVTGLDAEDMHSTGALVVVG